ncbi:SPOSA6832_03546, partial [Sporobolomyces salmonicolor]
MMLVASLLLPVLLHIALSEALSTAGTSLGSVLAVVESPSSTPAFSSFWQSVEDRGYELRVRSYEDAASELRQQGNTLDHLIVFASSVKKLSPQSLYRLVETGTNLLVALPPSASESWRDFGREFEVDTDDRGSQIIDHFSYDVAFDDGSHSTIVIPLAAAPDPFVSAATRAGPPILYRGAAHAIGRLPLLTPILHALSTSYSSDPDSAVEDVRLAGTAACLVTAFQARNNARVTFVGSTDIFTDTLINAPVELPGSAASLLATHSPTHSVQSSYPQSGNLAFLEDLTRWTFHETGVIHATAVEHRSAGEAINPSSYRVGDELSYAIDIASSGTYPADDFQLEAAETSGQTARYEANFTIPDRHGVFTMRVDHRRPGWTNVEARTVVSVTPPRHDEYDRFIQGALPYYGGALSVSAAFVMFVVLWTLQS